MENESNQQKQPNEMCIYIQDIYFEKFNRDCANEFGRDRISAPQQQQQQICQINVTNGFFCQV